MMKKLAALLLCLCLLHCTIPASADAPEGWKTHLCREISLELHAPRDFLRSHTPVDIRDMVGDTAQFSDEAPVVLASEERSAILIVLPLSGQYEPLTGPELAIVRYGGGVLSWMINLGTDAHVALSVLDLPDRQHPWGVTEYSDPDTGEYLAIYTPHFRDAHFAVLYLSPCDAITEEESGMLREIISHMTHTGL